MLFFILTSDVSIIEYINKETILVSSIIEYYRLTFNFRGTYPNRLYKDIDYRYIQKKKLRKFRENEMTNRNNSCRQKEITSSDILK